MCDHKFIPPFSPHPHPQVCKEQVSLTFFQQTFKYTSANSAQSFSKRGLSFSFLLGGLMSFRECQLFIIALALWRQEMKDPVDLPRHIIVHRHTDLSIVILCRNQICR